MWSGSEPSHIVNTLLDALSCACLQLDLIYVRLRDSGGQAPIEMVRFGRSSQRQRPSARTDGAGKNGSQVRTRDRRGYSNSGWGLDPPKWPTLIRNTDNRPGHFLIVPLGLGLQGEIG